MAVSFLGTFGIFDVNGNVVTIDKVQAEKIQEHLQSDDKISAIRDVRWWHGLSLQDAKSFVEHYAAHHVGSRK